MQKYGELMKNDKIKYFLCLLFFVVLAAITFRCTWPADHVFSASDLNIGRLALKKYSLPEQLTGAFGASPILGGSLYRYMFYNILVSIFPLEWAANALYGLLLVSGSLFMVWFLRIRKVSWIASVFGGLTAFWFNSVTLASAGHAYKMEVLVFSVLSLCLIEKAVRSVTAKASIGYSVLAGLSVGIMMIEQQDVALLAGLFVGPYAIFRLIQEHRNKVFRWAALMGPVAVVALALSGPMLLASYERNIAGAAVVQDTSADDAMWDYVTQWSMVPAEWPDLIAPGWGGLATGNPEGPYWGKIGRSEGWESSHQGFSNFKLDSIYIGIIPFLLGGYAFFFALRTRKTHDAGNIVFWGVAVFLGIWLSCGKYSILYKLFYQLPLFSDIRAPIKLLDNVQIALAVIAAYGVDRLLGFRAIEDKPVDRKRVVIICASVSFLLFLAGIWWLINPSSHNSTLSDLGLLSSAEVIVKNMANAWIHAGVLAFLCAIGVLLVWKRVVEPKWIGLALVLLLSIDSLMLTSRYFNAIDIAALKKGNLVICYLKENQGDDRAFFLDQGGVYNNWLASDGPFHQLNLFNVWQYPRMPVEYREFLSVVGKNNLRLWELSSVKHICAPRVAYDQLSKDPKLSKLFKPVLNYQMPTAKGMRPDVLLEFKNCISRLALFNGWKSEAIEQHCETLVNPQHDAQRTVLLSDECGLKSQEPKTTFRPVQGTLSKTSASAEVEVDIPSILRFSQRYQPGWRVLVDGKEAPLLKVDYLCMGVHLSVGKHVVVFKCPSGMLSAMFALGITLLSIFLAAWLIIRGREASQ